MPTKQLNGRAVEVTEEGFLVNPADWSEDIAPLLAKEMGIENLTDAHWKVIRFMRSDFEAKGQIPTIRRMKNEGGIPTKELYELFPEGPAKKAAYVSGLGKPQGCV